MIKVKIVKDGVKGADDGATVRPYVKGVIYSVSDALGEVFIEAGEATEVVEEKQSITDKLKAKGKSFTADKAAAEKEAADKAAAEKEAADKAAAAPVVPSIGLPGLPKAPGK